MASSTDAARAALDHLGEARVIVVLGAVDAGKSTLVATLAGALASGGARVGVVDADLGQSEIGPPAAVGLGRVAAGAGRLSEAALVALYFVGVTSPARDLPATVDGAGRMTRRARDEGFDRVVVDTCGLVTGPLGVALKRRQLDVIDPDLILVLARADECDPIVRGYAGGARPRVVRLAAPGRPGGRSPVARRAHRAAALERYLANARLLAMEPAGLTVQTPRGVSLEGCPGALCGLDDTRGDTLALGVVQDVSAGVVRVLAPPPATTVARIRIGRERRDGTPLVT